MKPTQQEIKDHLAGLNRTQRQSIISRESEIARDKGIAGYKKWFKGHGIPIQQEHHGAWKVTEVLDDIGVKQDK